MKKLLLSLGLVLVGSTAMAQIVFTVESPAAIQGAYEFKGNDDGSSWGLASLSGVLVIDTVVIPNDGTPGVNAQGNPASATGCNALPAGSLAGKVAMVFRGDGGNPGIGACGFGVKAQMCQNAGAVAVIIVNRDGTTLPMAGGTEGAAVTIPVIMINMATGQAIMNQIQNQGQTVVVLIGDKTGHFNDDITIYDNNSIRANFGSKPAALTQNASEFSLNPGGWVYNFGANNQTGVVLNTTIKRNGTEVYNQTSSSVNINSGDSVFMTTPAFSSASYAVGKYEVAYTVSMGTPDEYAGDNVSKNYFSISDSLWSLASLDPTGDVITKDLFTRAATLPNSQFEACIAFKDPNAHRVSMNGIYYGGFGIPSTDTSTVTLDGAEFNWSLYTWDDADQTINAGTFALISEVAAGSYIYPVPSAGLREKTIFMPITSDPYYRLDNAQSYLLCVTSYIPKATMAFSTKDRYDYAINQDNMIRFPIRNDANTWYNAGFVGFPVPAIAVRTDAALSVAENTIEAAAYPIPAKATITVKVKAAGDATLNIVDMAGRQVSTQKVKIENGQFQTSVDELNAGTYIFTLDYSNGTTSRFNVVVSK